ncbi:MAG: alanine racemase [Bacillota bacterium]
MLSGGRPTVLEIDLDCIAHNVRELKRLAPQAQLMATVKANAYGHGAVQVSRVALANGATWLGVATVEEGMELRRAGLKVPILVFSGLLPHQISACIQYDLDCALAGKNFISQIKPVLMGLPAGKRLFVHLKIDTGMHRLGILPKDLEVLLAELKRLPQVSVRGIWTHFAESASRDKSFSLKQLAIFQQCVEIVENSLGQIPLKHAANSGAVINLPQSHYNLIRPGLGIYGYYDEPHLAELVYLKPALTWKTRIISVREIPPGETVSYGRTYEATGHMKIATLPVGYADGYKRLLSNQGQVLIRGERANIIGRICMDQTMVDVTFIEGIKEGEEVVLLGTQGEKDLSIYEMCKWAQTIPYEILVSISGRVQRIYKGAAGKDNYNRGS